MQFPVVKNVFGKTIADSILSVLPAPMSNKHFMAGSELIDKKTGDVVMTYSYESSKPQFMDYQHSFGMGYAIADENGNWVYAKEDLAEFNRILTEKQIHKVEYEKSLEIRILKEEIEALELRLKRPEFKKNVPADIFTKKEEELSSNKKKLEALSNEN